MSVTKHRLLGIESIKIGACGANGLMGTDLTEIGSLVRETVNVKKDKPDVAKIYVEGADLPDLSVLNDGGALLLSFSTRDIKPANMVKAFGGAALPAIAGAGGDVTATITVNTIEVTGATFVTDGLEPGMQITLANSLLSNDGVYTIESIDSETQITVVENITATEVADVTFEFAGGWSAPAEQAILEQSVQLISKATNGYRNVITLPRGIIYGEFDGKMFKTDTGVINFEIDVQNPVDGSGVYLKPWHLTQVAVSS